MGEFHADVVANSLRSGLNNEPTVGWNDVLCGHIIPRTCSLLAFIGVALAVAEVKVCCERQITSDVGTLRDPCCESGESAERSLCACVFDVVTGVAYSRAVKRIAVTSGHCAFENILIVALTVVSIVAVVVAPETALRVLTPEAETHLLGIVCVVEFAPSTVEGHNPCALVHSVGRTACLNSHLCGVVHTRIGEVAG